MSDKEDEFTSIVEGQNEKHLFFHSSINKSTAFNLCTNLTALDISIRENNLDSRIIIHLSCPGGLVTSALLIADLIESLETKVDCIIEGNIASAAILILLACEKRTMRKHSQIFLHETLHGIDQIRFTDLNSFISDCKKINKVVKDFYINKTKLTLKQLNKFFKDEKTFNSKEALEFGFINA